MSPSKPAQSSPTPSGLDVANGTGNAHRGLDSLSPGATMRPRRSVDELNRGRATSPSKVTTASCSTPKRSMTGPSLAPDTPVTPSAPSHQRRVQLRSPWACSILTLVTTICAFALGIMIIFAFTGRQLDPKGAAMSYMRPKFVSFAGFDTEHTRFAGKYSLFLYRERGIDDDERVRISRSCSDRLLTRYRSKASPCSSCLGMLGAISKSVHSPPRQLFITNKACKSPDDQPKAAYSHSMSFPSISTKT